MKQFRSLRNECMNGSIQRFPILLISTIEPLKYDVVMEPKYDVYWGVSVVVVSPLSQGPLKCGAREVVSLHAAALSLSPQRCHTHAPSEWAGRHTKISHKDNR